MGVCCDASTKVNGIDYDRPITVTPKMLNLSDDELRAEVEQIWHDYDVSKTGKLSKEEAFNFLGDALKGVDGREPTESELESNFY